MPLRSNGPPPLSAEEERQRSNARELLEKIDALMVKHADAWVHILQAWWSVSGNPLFPMMAAKLFFDPRRPEAVTPEWLRVYMFDVSNNIAASAFALPSSKMPELLGRATGLVVPRRRVVEDALKLWESPLYIAVYEDLRSRAPGSARADWAVPQLRKFFDLHSDNAARARLTSARKTVRSVLRELGRPTDDEGVSASSREWLPVWAATVQLSRDAHLPAVTSECLAASFNSQTKYALFLAALTEQILRQVP